MTGHVSIPVGMSYYNLTVYVLLMAIAILKFHCIILKFHSINSKGTEFCLPPLLQTHNFFYLSSLQYHQIVQIPKMDITYTCKQTNTRYTSKNPALSNITMHTAKLMFVFALVRETVVPLHANRGFSLTLCGGITTSILKGKLLLLGCWLCSIFQVN